MKRYLLGFLLLFSLSLSFSQERDTIPKQSNPILYSELIMGYAVGNGKGFTIGGTANYQIKNDLFTLRYLHQTVIGVDTAVLGFTVLPLLTNELKIHEVSILYGKRYIKNGHSFSFSGGLSTNYDVYEIKNNTIKTKTSSQFIGFPFELNIKWFKNEKKRFRAYYGLIPIGKSTSFGRSFGFKLYGNIGRLSYVGLGINYGFGWHKKY